MSVSFTFTGGASAVRIITEQCTIGGGCCDWKTYSCCPTRVRLVIQQRGCAFNSPQQRFIVYDRANNRDRFSAQGGGNGNNYVLGVACSAFFSCYSCTNTSCGGGTAENGRFYVELRRFDNSGGGYECDDESQLKMELDARLCQTLSWSGANALVGSTLYCGNGVGTGNCNGLGI